MEQMEEQWRPIRGTYVAFAKRYEVSTYGRVRKADTHVVLKLYSNSPTARRQVQLYGGGCGLQMVQRKALVHQLVWETWREEPLPKFIGFADGNASNCRPENLIESDASILRGIALGRHNVPSTTKPITMEPLGGFAKRHVTSLTPATNAILETWRTESWIQMEQQESLLPGLSEAICALPQELKALFLEPISKPEMTPALA